MKQPNVMNHKFVSRSFTIYTAKNIKNTFWEQNNRMKPEKQQQSTVHYIIDAARTNATYKKSLTFSAVNLQVSRGQVVVHVMLVDLFKKALSLP